MSSFYPPKPDPLSPAERAVVASRPATICPPATFSSEVRYRYDYRLGANKGRKPRGISILERARDYAALGFSVAEIALVLNVSEDRIRSALG